MIMIKTFRQVQRIVKHEFDELSHKAKVTCEFKSTRNVSTGHRCPR